MQKGNIFDKGNKNSNMIVRCIIRVTALALSLAIFARELEYSSGEIEIYVLPGEATQVQFPDDVLGGYKKQGSLISVDKVGTDLIIFAQDKIVPEGEVILVRTKDNRSYSLRIKPAPDAKSRDDIVIVKDQRPRTALSDEDELPKYRDRQFIYPSQYQVAGLMREMVLATEFGKPAIPGYKVSDAGAGSVVVNNGQLHAKLVKMYLGPQLWGYVLEAENVTDETVKIDPSVFKINGTRAISLNKWELSPKPITTEQRYSEAHKAFVYIVAKAR